jgi:hypothetical protein
MSRAAAFLDPRPAARLFFLGIEILLCLPTSTGVAVAFHRLALRDR